MKAAHFAKGPLRNNLSKFTGANAVVPFAMKLIDEQLQNIANDSALVKSFFRHPSVSYISDL